MTRNPDLGRPSPVMQLTARACSGQTQKPVLDREQSAEAWRVFLAGALLLVQITDTCDIAISQQLSPSVAVLPLLFIDLE